MKYFIITTFAVVSLGAASIYFTFLGDSDAQKQALEPASGGLLVSVDTNDSEVEAGESTTESVPATDSAIPDNASEKMGAMTSASPPDNPSPTLAVTKKQMEPGPELASFTCPDDIPENIFQGVSRRAAESHEDDQAQLSVIKEQLKGYRDLKSFVSPSDVPDEVIEAIARKALESHRNDYSNQFILIAEQLAAYVELRGLKRPDEIPELVFQDVVQKAVSKMSDLTNFSALLFEIKSNLKAFQPSP